MVGLLKIMYYTKKYDREKTTIPKLFEETAKKMGDKQCILFQDQKWTFKEVLTFSDRVCDYFASQGFKDGDVVAIFTENCPEYMPMWVGMSKAGVVAALVNFNLRDVALSHCIRVGEILAFRQYHVK